ncbi:carboxylic ester hydrolase [Caerostris extrusa]|uniref:Carboxylic ester hydrolase n=1 Tax=Caerostris extrusa TaxID=172846 RepID=A0AAV4MNJ2_CAEEX|nr:carboxylic ester hydrolase [Caerostris extrusa]
MESGSAILMNNNYLQPNLQVSQRLAKAVECASDDNTIEDNPDGVVGCLREQNATYLAYVLWSLDPTSIAAFFPQYGDELLPNNAVDDIREGSFTNAVPLLIGSNKDEGSFLITTQNPEIFGFFGYKDPEINKPYAESMLLKIFSNFTDPQKYVNYYMDGVPDDDYDLIRRQVYTAAGDIMFLCVTVYFAESYAERNNDVYFYFSLTALVTLHGRPGWGSHTSKKFNLCLEDHTYSPILIVKILGSSSETRHPGMFLKGPKYSKANPTYMNIDVNPSINRAKLGTGPHLENCNVIRSHYGF